MEGLFFILQKGDEMSERTKCNFCDMKWIKKTAANVNKSVIKRMSTGELGGTNVYVVPSGTAIPEVIVRDDEFSKKYFVAWFWKLTDHCVC